MNDFENKENMPNDNGLTSGNGDNAVSETMNENTPLDEKESSSGASEEMNGTNAEPSSEQESERPLDGQESESFFVGAESFKTDPEEEKKKDKDFKGVWKRFGIVALAVVMAFSGAFFGMVWVCQTTILGDSDFFETLMIKNSGITLNRVDVDYISGNYQPTDSITLAEKVLKSTVEISILDYDEELYTYTDSGKNGSGVIIGYENGVATIVSNHHVLYGSKAFDVILHNGERCRGELLHLDEIGDLAVVQIKPSSPVTPVTVADSSKLLVGQEVIAAGNPLGLGLSVSYGHISNPYRDIGDEGGPFIQADVSVNPGNSGGGLYDTQGNLIGIVTAKASGNNVDGIGYAIPSNRMLTSVNDLFQYGYVKGRPALGVTVVTVNLSSWDYFNEGELAGLLEEYDYGVYIIGSKYYPDKLLKGDKVIAIDGVEITQKEQLSKAVLMHKAGETITLRIRRATKDAEGNFSYRTFDVSLILRERDWADENS